jgi:hypothetical protein
VAATVVRTPNEFEERLREYFFERLEEMRAVIAGEKESEQAAVVARYGDLFNREQLASLAEAEEHGGDDERERLHRLHKACEEEMVDAAVIEQVDAFENAELQTRVDFRGESLPLRAARARTAIEDAYGDRDELGKLCGDASAGLNPRRLELTRAREEITAELSGQPDPVARNEEEKGISLRQLADVLAEASALAEERWHELRERWFDRLLGPERERRPRSYHAAYMRRLSPLAQTYTKERAMEVCLASLGDLGFDLAADPHIRPDLDDRPQKSPRAYCFPSDPPQVVHLITRAMGGLHDYQSFLHESGHALHYAGCDPALPYAYRQLQRDGALTELYAYIVEKISLEPEWHARYFGLSDEQAEENAEAAMFLEMLLFRRYVAKLGFELAFWSRFAREGATNEEYAEGLEEATGLVYRPDGYLADMDAGFYSADYQRAWIRSAQLKTYLRREVGDDWWCSEATGDFLRELFREGTRPSNEEMAERIGFNALDVRPLLDELGVR